MNTIIRIGMSTSDIAAGAEATLMALETYTRHHQLPVTLKRTGSLGVCHREPVVEVIVDGASVLYGPVTPERVNPLLDQRLGAGGRGVSPDWVISCRPDRSDYPFLGRQVKVTTQLCGLIDPYSLEDYLEYDGYQAFKQALKMTPEAVVQLVIDSKLRGRGGAGFPTGIKWDLIQKKNITPKFLICNADEGDPGAFMDRAMIEGDPHRLLEGMLIAAYATGATKGYLYVRAEYPLAVNALRQALQQAEALGVRSEEHTSELQSQ